MARKNSLQYKKDLWKWEQSMIKSGQEKLLSPLKLKKHLAKSKVIFMILMAIYFQIFVELF